MAVPTFHALYAAGFFGTAAPSSSSLPWPSPRPPGLGSQLILSEGDHDAAGFASCCGPLACTLPDWRARPRASTPRSPQTPAGCYKGDLVPPLAGLPPASHRELSGRTGPQAPPTRLCRAGPQIRAAVRREGAVIARTDTRHRETAQRHRAPWRLSAGGRTTELD